MITLALVLKALRTDTHVLSGIVRNSFGYEATPREVWLSQARLWVRASGHRVTGWPGGNYHAREFGPLSAWRIRRAFRSWERRHA